MVIRLKTLGALGAVRWCILFQMLFIHSQKLIHQQAERLMLQTMAQIAALHDT